VSEDGATRAHFERPDVSLLQGDCIAVMKGMPEASVDAIVTDPPYGLEFMGKEWDRLGIEGKTHWDRAGVPRSGHPTGGLARWTTHRPRYSAGCEMQAWHEAWAREALRVLKPGGHLLAFGSSRTHHRLFCAIEDAGFECRDTLVWLHAVGFPKSLNVSSALRERLPASSLCACAPRSTQTTGDSLADYPVHRRFDDGRPLEALDTGRGVLPLSGDALARSHAGLPGDALAEGRASISPDVASGHPSNGNSSDPSPLPGEESQSGDSAPCDTASSTSSGVSTAGHRTATRKSGNSRSVSGSAASSASGDSPDRVYPNLPQCANCGKAQIPEGIGTALKPAAEFICLARKPLASPTVAANVLAHGTGALNIAATRIGTESTRRHRNACENGIFKRGFENAYQTGGDAGRWPANVCLTHTPDCEHIGTRRVKGSELHHVCGTGEGYGFKPQMKHGYTAPDGTEEVEAWRCTPDCPIRLLDEQAGVRSGDSAGRKPRLKMRDKFGWSGPAAQDVNTPGYPDTGGASRFYFTAKASRSERGHGNNHPTVKPVALLRWLCRLITPPGGLVLDPFAGSGSTALACRAEGFRFIGIDQEGDYLTIGVGRMAQEVLNFSDDP